MMKIHAVHYCLCEKGKKEPSVPKTYLDADLTEKALLKIPQELKTLLEAYIQKIINQRPISGVTEERFKDYEEEISVKQIFDELRDHFEDNKLKDLLSHYGYVLGNRYINIENSRDGLLFVVLFQLNAGRYIACIRTELKDKEAVNYYREETGEVKGEIFEKTLPKAENLSKAGLYPSIMGGTPSSNMIKIFQKDSPRAQYIYKFFNVGGESKPEEELELVTKIVVEGPYTQQLKFDEFKGEMQELMNRSYEIEDYKKRLVQRYPDRYSDKSISSISLKRQRLDRISRINPPNIKKGRIAINIGDNRIPRIFIPLEYIAKDKLFLAKLGEFKLFVIKTEDITLESEERQKIEVTFDSWEELKAKLEKSQ
ncbi:MAG: hypothetical protein ACFFC7_35115 [Candidatus Hermodarchaeota archaeon]